MHADDLHVCVFHSIIDICRCIIMLGCAYLHVYCCLDVHVLLFHFVAQYLIVCNVAIESKTSVHFFEMFIDHIPQSFFFMTAGMASID